MKALLLALLVAASAPAATVADHLGLQMYSLRVQSMQQGWRAALDQAKALGFKVIEGGGPPRNVTAGAYKADLAARGLRLVSAGFAYEQLAKDIAGAVAQARELGVQYAAVAWIPHKDADPFTDDDARKAAADFNAWGAAFRAAGITFAYHPHGYEFRPAGNGDTPFDVLVRSTNPESVHFEMDVFWATHGGQNPAALLAKYPGRWKLMHVKGYPEGGFHRDLHRARPGDGRRAGRLRPGRLALRAQAGPVHRRRVVLHRGRVPHPPAEHPAEHRLPEVAQSLTAGPGGRRQARDPPLGFHSAVTTDVMPPRPFQSEVTVSLRGLSRDPRSSQILFVTASK